MNKEETIESLCKLAEILERRGEINLWCEIIQILHNIEKNECSTSLELTMVMKLMDEFGVKYDPADSNSR